MIQSTSISKNANNPSNWGTDYSRSSSMSSASNFYPISLENDQNEDTESDTGVRISEYLSDDEIKEVFKPDPVKEKSRTQSKPSWLEREMTERKQFQNSPERKGQFQNSPERKGQSQQQFQNSPEVKLKRTSSRQELVQGLIRRKTEVNIVKQQAPSRPASRTGSSSAAMMSQSYPGSSTSGSRQDISGSRSFISGTDTEDDILAISDFEDKEKTPMPSNEMLSSNLSQYKQFIQERPPPAVAMARRRPSWEERVERLPTQPPR